MDFFSDPIAFIANLLRTWLAFIPEPWLSLLLMTFGVVVVGSAALVLPLFTIWLERRVIARMQDRIGPNRVGYQGLLQTIADAIKLMTKEDITPLGADKVVYNLAPILVVISVITMWAVLPFAVNIYGADLNIGVLYIVAVGSLGTLAIMLGGWASNNKYALLGAFRTVAQLVCYEVPMILSMVVPVLIASSWALAQGQTDFNPMSLKDIVVAQQSVPFLLVAPVAALIFFISSVAETGRAPFDLLEAESEIVAGFNIEYSGMKFGMFMVAEFLHAFTVGALVATLFLGGWHGPWATQYPLLGMVYFLAKSFAAYFLIVLMRAALPRIRIDHLFEINWKFLVPLAVAAIVVTMVVNKLVDPAVVGLGWNALALFASNLVVAWVAFNWASAQARWLRRQEEAKLQALPDLPGGHDEAHSPAQPAGAH
ncbi:MAG: NADH-quinone oxidoreductase subunit NuoH [Anaerolineales bacterium]|nr:NADH-quinone oxidoreductase subunit NuoH [Anaerolineales bacterium]